MKQPIKRTIIASFALVFISLPAVAFAHDNEHTETDSESNSGKTSTSETNVSVSVAVTDQKSRAEAEARAKQELLRKEQQKKLDALEANAKQKLDDSKRPICEKQQSSINTVMGNMDKRRQNAFDHITSVSEAVQAFVVKKNVKITNYDGLIATIVSAKAAAQTAMNTQQAVPEFNCNGDHPRSDINDFKQKRSASIDANGAYRDAVRYLIKAVKAAVEPAKVSAS